MTTINYTDSQKALQPRLAQANINADSFLATDYLNHFNEITMMLEMVADMPDMLEDTQDWAPKSYQDHFRDSGFQQKGLAIEAYEKCPEVFKAPFDAAVDGLNNKILATIRGLTVVCAADRGLTPEASELIRGKIKDIQDDLLVLNGIIHARLPEKEVAAADISASSGLPESEAEDVQTQADIDLLFD